MKNNGKISFGLCALLLFPALAGAALAGCSSAVDPSKATATLSSTRAYGKNTAEKAMDGDLTSGWISAGMPSETNIPVLEVNFDRKAAVTSITIDDSFAGGRTTEIKEYETFLPSLKSSAFAYTSMPREGKTAIDVFAEETGGWSAEAVPSAEAPQAFYGEFRTAAEVDRIVTDNSANDLVHRSFQLFVCETAVPQAEKLNPSYEGWKTVLDEKENSGLQREKTFESTQTVRAVLYVLYEQEGENQPACLNGLYMQKKLDEPDGAHYPVDFNLLYSADGETYEIVEVRKNDSPVYTYTFPEKTAIRSIRYLPLAEYGNNKPSVGEIIVK